MSTQTTRDDDVSRELINTLRAVGASDAFITVIQTSPEEAGAERNSCRAEVLKWVRWNDGEVTEEAMKPHYGGGFFKKVWDGEIGEAYGHADSNNQAILIEAFGVNYINRNRPSHLSEVTA